MAEEQSKETIRCLQVAPVEYMLEMNSELKRVLAVAADLKKKAAVKWAAYHKLQAKPVKTGANALEEEGKTEVELSKDAATEATAEWTNFVRVRNSCLSISTCFFFSSLFFIIPQNILKTCLIGSSVGVLAYHCDRACKTQ